MRNREISGEREGNWQKPMGILYALVARGTTVLAEFSAVTGNAGAIVRRILEKLPAEAESRLCFSQDGYIFHILRSDSLTFLCMANDTLGRRIPFSYLENIQMRFIKNYGRVAPCAPAYGMNDEFSRVLHQQMEFFSSNPSADTLNRVRSEVSEASILFRLKYQLMLLSVVHTNVLKNSPHSRHGAPWHQGSCLTPR